MCCCCLRRGRKPSKFFIFVVCILTFSFLIFPPPSPRRCLLPLLLLASAAVHLEAAVHVWVTMLEHRLHATRKLLLIASSSPEEYVCIFLFSTTALFCSRWNSAPLMSHGTLSTVHICYLMVYYYRCVYYGTNLVACYRLSLPESDSKPIFSLFRYQFRFIPFN